MNHIGQSDDHKYQKPISHLHVVKHNNLLGGVFFFTEIEFKIIPAANVA